MTTPAINFYAICNALAARFEAATIGTPTGAPAMRKVYAQTPKNVPVVPAVVLEVQEGSVVANPGQWKHELGVDVLFLLSKRPGDPVRVEADRQRWLPYLLHATVDAGKLGMTTVGYAVDKAIPTEWEWVEYAVGGVEFDAIRVGYRVYVTENVQMTP